MQLTELLKVQYLLIDRMCKITLISNDIVSFC